MNNNKDCRVGQLTRSGPTHRPPPSRPSARATSEYHEHQNDLSCHGDDGDYSGHDDDDDDGDDDGDGDDDNDDADDDGDDNDDDGDDNGDDGDDDDLVATANSRALVAVTL